MYQICICLLFCLTGCSTADENTIRRRNEVATYIDRHHDEHLFQASAASWVSPDRYSWEVEGSGHYPRITKDFFRCRGCELNPVRIVESNHIYDCGGADRHSLPLRDNKEFVYPILVDLLNELQDKTGKRVVITSGHRCPEHNRYVDPSTANSTSKHMIAAEASFYIQGLENRPDEALKIIFDYYRTNPKYQADKAYTEFQRYDKETDIATPPWYNKEVFVKIYQREEGRDFDNRHPYPYISVQVRYDWDKKERVQYTWKDAQRNYLRS
ncbi:MAG: D-Ala-D-Ala carboxypeptidase family metallohydrolase [Chlamydiales bacterium]|nr:D-Ala-D-Ala carboxypeptidase family metallohydrolase [Chlamydiales bacterium]